MAPLAPPGYAYASVLVGLDQARNQLETSPGARSFLRRPNFFNYAQ